MFGTENWTHSSSNGRPSACHRAANTWKEVQSDCTKFGSCPNWNGPHLRSSWSFVCTLIWTCFSKCLYIMPCRSQVPPKNPKTEGSKKKVPDLETKPLVLKSFGTIRLVLKLLDIAVLLQLGCLGPGLYGATVQANPNYLSTRGKGVLFSALPILIWNCCYNNLLSKDCANQIFWWREFSQACKKNMVKKGIYMRPATAEHMSGWGPNSKLYATLLPCLHPRLAHWLDLTWAKLGKGWSECDLPMAEAWTYAGEIVVPS